ncbi:MAG: response regulator transcription factor [Kiritimatiellia bacterium]
MNASARILIADDDRHLLAMMSDILVRAGHSVLPVKDGGEAVEAHLRHAPDLIILDVMMPRMSGPAACREIRKTDAEVPILFFTAYPSEENELKGLGVGGDDFIAKAASEEVLLARVSAALRRCARSTDGNFLFGYGHVDATAQTFFSPSGAVRLTEREVLTLREFARHPNEVFSKDGLLTRLKGIDFEGDPRLVDKVIERLRAKLGSSASTIVTIPRQGLAYQPPHAP